MIIWEEDFTDGDITDWDLYAWEMTNDIHTTPIDSGFSVIDGVLYTPDYASYGKKSHAIHNSTQAYGSWSFDWLVSSPAHIGIEFMFTDVLTNYNLTGLHQTQLNYTGYAVLLVSFPTVLGLGLRTPGINLLKFKNTDNTSIIRVLDTHEFAATVTGTHHIEISRSLQGLFTVYYDSELTLQATDNVTTTSEKFGITSWLADTGIDNITISDSYNPPPSTTTTTSTTTQSAEGYVLWMLIPSFIVLMIVRRRKANE
jgi:hypothetical protein